MYKRIVVAVGDDPELDTAVAYAIALAAHTEAELWLLRVCTVPLIFGAPDMVTCSHLAMEHVMEAHAHLLACAVAAAEEAGVSYTATSEIPRATRGRPRATARSGGLPATASPLRWAPVVTDAGGT